jgi:purine-binding chemotaxis protein CheW
MATTTPTRAHLAFALAGDRYLVPIERVRELVAAAPLTPLPGAPAWVRGIFNLRGAVVPVVDLGSKLGVGASAPTSRTSWLVVELECERRREVLALETDEVLEIVAVGEDELLATPPAGIRARVEHVRGVVAYGEGFGLVLDLERVLLEGAANAQAGEAGGAGR